jgi:acyl carrier protein
MADLQKKIADKLVEQLDIDPAKITSDARFVEDLEMDSLDMVEMVIGMEKDLGVSIDNDEAKDLKTVGDLIKYIEAKQQNA